MMHQLRRWGIEIYQKLSGRRITKAFDELLKTQWLSRDELYALQQRKLFRLIEYAHRYVPYYQRQFKEIGFEPGDLKKHPDCFHQLPLLDKAVVRESSEDFFTTEPGRRKTLIRCSTSGSTGEPLIFWKDLNNRDYETAGILRHLTWSGWKPGNCHAYLWAFSLHPNVKWRMRFLIMNILLNRFFSNTLSISMEAMEELARKIRRRRPYLLFGYPSSLYHFAGFVEERGLSDIRLSALYTSAEMLFPHLRRVIERAFGGRIFNRYAVMEAGDIACECEMHNGMHISMESCLLEILEGDKPVELGKSGQVVTTNLNNFGFPFIRYRLDDVAAWSPINDCPCGRRHPMLARLEGRRWERFRTKDGRLIAPDFNGAVFEVGGVKQYRTIQKSYDLVLIKLVISKAFQKDGLQAIERQVKELMGPDTSVKFEFLDSIPLEKSGKFCYARSEIKENSRNS